MISFIQRHENWMWFSTVELWKHFKVSRQRKCSLNRTHSLHSFSFFSSFLTCFLNHFNLNLICFPQSSEGNQPNLHYLPLPPHFVIFLISVKAKEKSKSSSRRNESQLFFSFFTLTKTTSETNESLRTLPRYLWAMYQISICWERALQLTGGGNFSRRVTRLRPHAAGIGSRTSPLPKREIPWKMLFHTKCSLFPN